jgi:hypothetical protein
MLHWMSLALTLTFVSSVWAQSHNTVVEETLYHDFQKSIESHAKNKSKSFAGVSSYDQSLFVDALWDLADENSPAALAYLDQQVPLYYDLVQKLRLGILRIKYNRATVLPEEVAAEIASALQSPQVDLKIVYLIAAYEPELMKTGHKPLIELAKRHPSYFDIIQDEDAVKNITEDEVADLFNMTPDVTTYMNGEYVKSVKIFMFCRNNRLYPCLMVMKNVHGEAVRADNGKLWSNPSLASSAKGLPSYQRNGNTPEGVLTIDSVMPVADAQTSFGKFRRMILNFVPKSKNETLIKSLLPVSSHGSEWWKNGVVSRDIGRNLFRIHGTGKINMDPTTPYYPFMRTSGCVAQKENTYDGVTYQNQRNLLDSVMKAMDMIPSFENEPNIKGLLYVVEIDDKNAPVTLDDLALRGIE